MIEHIIIKFVILILVIIFVENIKYLNLSKYVEKYALKRERQTKILSAPNEVKRILDQPNPCGQLNLIDLDFILLSEEKLELLNKLKSCFKNKENFMRGLDSAFTVDSEDLITNFFIPFARQNLPHLIPRIFYECAFHSKYQCIKNLIDNDTLINYKGHNILHLAAKLDDLNLASILNTNPTPLLHLRDFHNQTPAVYIQSKELLIFFIARCAIELSSSPFKLEIRASIEHARIRLTKDQFYLQNIFGRSKSDTSSNLSMMVNRNSILYDSYQNIVKEKLWYNPKVQFDFFVRFNEERAIDHGGATMEWLSLLLDSFFIPSDANDNLPLFEPVSEDSKLYAPTNYYHPSVYKFAGSMIVEAMKKRLSLKVEFIPSFYRKLYDIEPIRVDDMEIQCPQLYKNLLFLLEETEEAEIVRQSMDIEHLSKVPDYIQLYTGVVLYKKYRQSLKAFVLGIHSKSKASLSNHYNLNELKLFMKGATEEISFKQLSAIIKFRTRIPEKQREFLQILESFSSEKLLKFFKFVTGRNSIPYGGLSFLPFPITVLFFGDHFWKGLPKASTCDCSIRIPLGLSKAELEYALIFAIENCDTLDLP
jgi:hypothetical protein